MIASASLTGLSLWSVDSNELVATFEGAFSSVVFSPNGSLIASASPSGDLILRDVSSGDKVFVVKGFTPISQAVFHNEYIASTIGMNVSSVLDIAGGAYYSADRDAIVLRDISTGEIIRTFSPAEAPDVISEVNSFIFSPGENIIASTWRIINIKTHRIVENIIIFFDVTTGEQLDSLHGFEPISFSPDSLLLATGETRSQLVLLIDISSGEALPFNLGSIPGLFGEPYKKSVIFSPDSSIIAILSNRIVLRDISTGKKLKIFESGFDELLAFTGFERGGTGVVGEFSPNGKILATSSLLATSENPLDPKPKGTVILWDVMSGEKLFVLEGHTEPITSLAYSPDGTLLATGAKDNAIILWDVQSGNLVKTLLGHTGAINSLSFSSEGSLLYSNALDGTVIIWSLDQLLQ